MKLREKNLREKFDQHPHFTKKLSLRESILPQALLPSSPAFQPPVWLSLRLSMLSLCALPSTGAVKLLVSLGVPVRSRYHLQTGSPAQPALGLQSSQEALRLGS